MATLGTETEIIRPTGKMRNEQTKNATNYSCKTS